MTGGIESGTPTNWDNLSAAQEYYHQGRSLAVTTHQVPRTFKGGLQMAGILSGSL